MTAAQLQRLRALLTDEQLLQLAAEFPSFRIPSKKLERQNRRKEFFLRLSLGQFNIPQLSKELQIPRSTLYSWLPEFYRTPKTASKEV